MLNYTKEPWSLETHQLIEAGFYNSMFPESDGYELSIEDFERASECVNALAGIEDVEAFVNEAKRLKEVTNA